MLPELCSFAAAASHAATELHASAEAMQIRTASAVIRARVAASSLLACLDNVASKRKTALRAQAHRIDEKELN